MSESPLAHETVEDLMTSAMEFGVAAPEAEELVRRLETAERRIGRLNKQLRIRSYRLKSADQQAEDLRLVCEGYELMVWNHVKERRTTWWRRLLKRDLQPSMRSRRRMRRRALAISLDRRKAAENGASAASPSRT